MEDEIEDKTESPHEEKYPQMPRLGSRVRRGRDWRYDDHDNYGPGTIVSHLKEGKHKIRNAESDMPKKFYRIRDNEYLNFENWKKNFNLICTAIKLCL